MEYVLVTMPGHQEEGKVGGAGAPGGRLLPSNRRLSSRDWQVPLKAAPHRGIGRH